ncbi:hypothetical protein F0U44_07775 [Nocardioides humilatus]|uniref:Type II secretion system protein GspF domain-containing protein n=1 Tax=Nocardioides humilatus TaxID=2607660 RepID=A0A5B1LIT5_9ACTN|nr:type II secretion system F family protein [Nocardioides humilatus]KAA1420304.1 hypothetical protein F0U44_07775 [Nocardioides humilatus]
MTGWAALACLLAGAGGGLLTPAGSGVAQRGRRSTTSYGVVVIGLAGAVWLLAGEPRLLVIGGIGAAVLVVVGRLVVRNRHERAAVRVRVQVVEMCAAVQAELAAGQTPSAAIGRAADEWPALAAVGRTAAGGGDVPQALRDLASLPGAGDLCVVAAAWQVAHRTGHGLADTLGRVAQHLREAEQTRRVVSGELASARATARLVAGLPLVALVLGSGAGSDPWAFLLSTPVGLGCLGGGLACGLAGLWWIEALARDVERAR